MLWLRTAVLMAEQTVGTVKVEHYTSIPPLGVKSATFEEAITLMEAHTFIGAGLYLNPKAWKKKGVEKGSWPGPGGEQRPEELAQREESGCFPEGLDTLPPGPRGEL